MYMINQNPIWPAMYFGGFGSVLSSNPAAIEIWERLKLALKTMHMALKTTHMKNMHVAEIVIFLLQPRS